MQHRAARAEYKTCSYLPHRNRLATVIAECLRPRRVPLVCVLGLGAALGVAAPVQAATFTVTSTADGGVGSLRQAIIDANASPGSDQILFDSSVTGTIVLTSGPLISDGFASYYYENAADRLVITGPGAERLTIDGNADSSVIASCLYGDDSSLAISGLTLKNADRGLLISGSFGVATAITITDSIITGTAEAGIEIYDWYYTGWGAVQLENLVISGNSGTGIVIVGGDTEIVGSVIADNLGSGIHTVANASRAGWPVAIDTSVIARNVGDGVSCGGYRGASVLATQITDNGGVGLGCNASVLRSTLSGNRAGGIAADSVVLVDSAVFGNQASDGGGIRIANSYHGTGGHLAVINSTISGNEAESSGGGIYQYTGTTVIESSTITGNTAVVGGGLFKRFYDEWGWGDDILVEATRIHNTIVAGNAATSDPDLRSGLPSAWEFILPVALSYSLIGEPGDAYITDAIPGSNRFGEDPQLGLLQDNGGPTKTHAPRLGSPALDSGDPSSLFPPLYDCSWLLSSDSCGLTPPDWDQRGEGFARVRNGRIDMGACELRAGEVLKGGAWLRSLGDSNGDGTPEVAVVKRDTYGRDLVSVRDAASGSLVSTFNGTSSGRLLAVTVMPDPDAGPSLALLGSYASSNQDTVSYSVAANTQAVLSGDLLGWFALNPGARPVDMTVLPDQDGNGVPELGLLTAAPTQVEVRDAFTGRLHKRLTFPSRFDPRQVLSVPDLNGNGSAEVGVVLSRADEADRVIISDTLTKQQIRVVMPGTAYRALTLREAVVVADRNHNGAGEVAMLLRNPVTGETLVWVADALTNALLAKVVGYRKDVTPETLVAVSDLTRNGVEEFALLGRSTATGEVTAEIRDGANSALVRRIWFKKECTPLDLVSIGDVNGNGAAELVMLGRCGTEAQLRAFVVDAKTGASLRRLDF